MKKNFDIGFSGNWKENLDKNNCLYIITNTINNKKYIGIAKNLRKRLYMYKYEVLNHINRAIINAILKYGINNFSFDYIKSLPNYSDLLKEEVSYVYTMKEKFSIYNETNGGENPPKNTKSGYEIYNAKLNIENINYIFKSYFEDKKSVLEICKKLNISDTITRNVLKGKTYKKETLHLIEKYKEYAKPKYKNINIGSNNYQSKLNKNDIKNIFNIYHNEKLNCFNIANKYNVNKSTISKILLGKIYKEESKDLINIFPKPRKSTNHINYKLNSGELNNKSKLKENQVKEILYMFYIKKIKVKEIKNIFKITEHTIYDLLKGKTWKDLYKNFILKYDIQINS